MRKKEGRMESEGKGEGKVLKRFVRRNKEALMSLG